MIRNILGKVIELEKGSVVVNCTGVGYQVFVLGFEMLKLKVDDDVKLFTYHKVTDSSQQLYGFFKREQRDFFELVLSVSGIGPKSAMNVLGLGSIDQISAAIVRSDVKYLTAVQGMGKKTAERMVVELKNKINKSDKYEAQKVDGSVLSDVIAGLVSLGYTQAEARVAVEGIDTEGKDTQAVLKEVLGNFKK